MSAHDSHPPSSVIDKHFRILALPNGPDSYQGGQSVVYRGQDKRNGVYVAIKIPHATEGFTLAESQQRFAREVAFLEKLDHPGIVRLYGCSKKPDQRPFCVMPWIAGVTLRQAMQQPGVLPLPMRLIILQALETLQYLHGQGVLHRDIKPENLIYDEHHRQLVLIDLGIATKTDTPPSNLTGRTLLGTPKYLAPELLEGKPHTTGTDLWALTKTLLDVIKAVSGTNPDFSVILQRILDAPPDQRQKPGQIAELIKELNELSAENTAATVSPAAGNTARTKTLRDTKPQQTDLREFLKKARATVLQPGANEAERDSHLQELGTLLRLPLKTQIQGIDFTLQPFIRNHNNEECCPFYISTTQITKKQFCLIDQKASFARIYAGKTWPTDDTPADGLTLAQCLEFADLMKASIRTEDLPPAPSTGALIARGNWSPALPTPTQMRIILTHRLTAKTSSTSTYRLFTHEPNNPMNGSHETIEIPPRGQIATISQAVDTEIANAGFHITLSFRNE
jgi:serine/threonine protein kinase